MRGHDPQAGPGDGVFDTQTERAARDAGAGVMDRAGERIGAMGKNDRGFAMLIAIFALLIMSTVAVAALVSADDERRSARAVQAASASFYAAEAGLQAVWATKLDSAFVDSLEKGKIIAPGGSLDLGWKTLSNGARYNVRLQRYDNGGQKVYGLVAEGRGASRVSGQQVVTFRLTTFFANSDLKLGKCCEAAATVRGVENIAGTTTVTGMDAAPSSWTAARCTGIATQNKAGIRMADTTQLTKGGSATLAGSPPKVQDTTLTSTDFLNYGGYTFDQLKAMANFTFGSGNINLAATVNADGTCKTTDPYNWGSNNPVHPCYNYFPIILVNGALAIKSGYGQALVLLNRVTGVGNSGRFELGGPSGSQFAGMIIGFGCPEIEGSGHQFYGAIFVDKLTQGNCGGASYGLGDASGRIQWSGCVVQRLLEATGVGTRPVLGAQKLTHGFGTTLR